MNCINVRAGRQATSRTTTTTIEPPYDHWPNTIATIKPQPNCPSIHRSHWLVFPPPSLHWLRGFICSIDCARFPRQCRDSHFHFILRLPRSMIARAWLWLSASSAASVCGSGSGHATYTLVAGGLRSTLARISVNFVLDSGGTHFSSGSKSRSSRLRIHLRAHCGYPLRVSLPGLCLWPPTSPSRSLLGVAFVLASFNFSFNFYLLFLFIFNSFLWRALLRARPSTVFDFVQLVKTRPGRGIPL